MYNPPLVADDSAFPELLETAHMRLRPLTGYDVVITMWVRQSRLEDGLDDHLFETVRSWTRDYWPFGNPAYPGRKIPFEDWQAIIVQSKMSQNSQ